MASRLLLGPVQAELCQCMPEGGAVHGREVKPRLQGLDGQRVIGLPLVRQGKLAPRYPEAIAVQ